MLLDRAIEPRCLVCSGPCDSAKASICEGCLSDLPTLENQCQRCALPLQSAEIHICGSCMNHPPAFDSAWAAFRYAPPLPKLVQQWKYNGQLSLNSLLIEQMSQRVSTQPLPDVIVPVPLHRSRLRQRGFNQAMILAHGIAARFDLPLIEIERPRKTPKQATLSAKQRKRNLQGAFSSARDFSGMHVAVIDDVMTTGATVTEITKLLRKQGARRVDIWLAARALSAKPNTTATKKAG